MAKWVRWCDRLSVLSNDPTLTIQYLNACKMFGCCCKSDLVYVWFYVYVNKCLQIWLNAVQTFIERTNERVWCQQFCMWTMVDHNRYCIVSIFVIQKPSRLGKVHLCALRFSVDGSVFFSFIKSIPIHKPHKNYLCVPLFSQTCWQTLYHVWTVHLIHAEIIQRHLNSTPLLFDSNTPASGEPRGWCQPPKLHVYKTHRFFKQTPF